MTTAPSPTQRQLWHELTDLAASVAVRAGAAALDMADEARSRSETKSSSTDLVTAADRAAEELITEGLLRARPDDSILGEEGAAQAGTSPVTWHVDPIDGTTNYVYAIPNYCVSIAAEVDGVMVAGAVVNPVTGDHYRATLGSGASCNGQPIRCSPVDELATALVATGFGYRVERRRQQGRVVAALLPRVRDIRRFGSAALDLCAVATGQVDAYYERGLNRWDLAAGALIAAEAGAAVTNLDGGPPDEGFVLAAGPALHGLLGDLLRRLEAGDEG